MRRHGLEAEERVPPGDHTEEPGIETGRLLTAERERGLPLQTSVLAGNDNCPMGPLTPLRRRADGAGVA